jgi:hypothetical protein
MIRWNETTRGNCVVIKLNRFKGVYDFNIIRITLSLALMCHDHPR